MAGSYRAQGRGSASAAAAVLVGFLLFVQGTVAADFPVDGTGTWGFSSTLQSWSDGNQYQEGDTISFNYSPSSHDLVILTKADWDSCTVANPISTHTSGADMIPLGAGTTYFTCAFPGHCSGMKFSATVAQAAAPPTVPATPPTVPATPPTTPATPPTAPVTPPTAPATPPTGPATPPTVPTPRTPGPAPSPPPPPTTRSPPRPAPQPAPSAAGSVKATLATVFGAAALALVM